MIRICTSCLGLKVVDAEKVHRNDIEGRWLTGMVPCILCRDITGVSRGYLDYHVVEAHQYRLELKQRMLRAAVDLGGSPFSRESLQFKVGEIRWNAISSVYFKPAKVAELLGLIFPTDLEEIDTAVQRATWSPGSLWKVSPATQETDHLRLCQKLQRQLNQQYRIDTWPQFEQWDLPVDNTEYVPLKDLAQRLDLIQRGHTPTTDWRDVVAAVQAMTAQDNAA